MLEEFGKQPEQEGRVQTRRIHQLVGSEDVDKAQAVIGLQQIVDIEHRLAKKAGAALLFERQQTALDGTD